MSEREVHTAESRRLGFDLGPDLTQEEAGRVLQAFAEAVPVEYRTQAVTDIQTFLELRINQPTQAKIRFPNINGVLHSVRYYRRSYRETPYEAEIRRVDESGGYYQGIC